MKYCKDCVFYHPTEKDTIHNDMREEKYNTGGGFCAVTPPTSLSNKLPWIPAERPKCRFFQQVNPFDKATN